LPIQVQSRQKLWRVEAGDFFADVGKILAMNRTAVLYALASAALFGASTPAAKALLGSINPVILAGLLYCGAGIGIAILRRAVPAVLASPQAGEQALGRGDWPWLAGAIAAGGVLGPILLMAGLARTDAATASLLLTLEGAATALMAWFIFRENFDRRIAIGMLCLLAGAAVLAWSGTPSLDSALGPLAILGACIAWCLDNNLTRKVSLADPLQIVELKGLIAGPVNVALGLGAGVALPDLQSTLVARISRLWRKPRVVRAGASPPRHGPHRGLFLHGAIPGRGGGYRRARRTGHGAFICCRRPHGPWGVAASHRRPRA
jgi:drug/metabolite transporter (DMT)-like permease